MASRLPKLFPIDPADPAGWPAWVSAPLRRLLEYWVSIGKAGRYPTRTEIEPGALAKFLPWIFITERLPGEPVDYRFQLVGTEIVNVEGECTGQRLSDLFPDRTKFARLWKHYDDACVGVIGIRLEDLGWRGKKHIDYQVVLLPLRGDTGETAYLIGAAYAMLTPD